jgi:WD repeat-containing protein 19
MILHSYTLVKRFVKMQDHMAAARMLIRVAKNISQFPAHTVQILTSAVIECTRAGLKTSAYQWACILVRPEFRSSLDEKYKKQIEKVAIRRPTSEDPPEETSPCPFCNSFIYDTDLECENCKNTIPYCIASGRHMLLSEWTQCVSCKFPANVSQFARMLEADPTCPMCESKVNSSSLRLLNDPVTELKMLTAVAKEDNE